MHNRGFKYYSVSKVSILYIFGYILHNKQADSDTMHMCVSYYERPWGK